MEHKFNIGPVERTNGNFDIPGSITKNIGTGENAKHSIIYLVLKWAFVAGIIITTLIIINNWFFRDCENKVPDVTDDLRIVWEIVVPIITLALGYEFGKK